MRLITVRCGFFSRGLLSGLVAGLLALAGLAAFGPGLAAAAAPFGPNVVVISPSMPQSTVQATLDRISTQQVPTSSQFGTQRYTVFFEPGTYGSTADPLDFQVGYYTQVAGLGRAPGDVVINGAINVFNQCSPSCDGTDNFWRSLSNLTLNVHRPSSPPAYAPYSGDPYSAACDNSADMWAVSQAAPMRRVIVNGSLVLQDYCSPTGYVSGGYFADDEFNGGTVGNDGQQQFFTRNSNIDSWSNGVWNQVFLGDNGAPATDFHSGPPTSNQYTTVPTTPVSQEEPFLYTGAGGKQRVFVPAVRTGSVGPSYSTGAEAGRSISIRRFFIASPSTSVAEINAALRTGRNLILTPGVYALKQTIRVQRADTVVLGLGFATLVAEHGRPAMTTGNAPGIKLSGMIFDAGAKNSRVLLQVGHGSSAGRADDPSLLQDVFFRIGGAEPGQATTSLIVNSSHAILDDVWAWRADHGAGAAWTSNRAQTGVIVNGDYVHAYGLAVEHYQKFEVIWNGQHGEDVFFQNEMPYDPPSQSAWMSSPSTDGYAAFLVAPQVTSFTGYGMGSYSFFNQGVPIYAAQAFQSPNRPGVNWNDLLTVFLNPNGGSGGIRSVINGVGGSSTAANPSQPVDVAHYP
jgi:hypothetical protein